ncbi:unnamed protein product [Trichogramma brassicae]|uniref:Uncharacterized protein n=1 Tax=Trichogramma brassicae TaxID=86971 RepID=A0A6H5J6B5_9HYME|nr:unnamed protein product [Trichogramma brassicae]
MSNRRSLIGVHAKCQYFLQKCGLATSVKLPESIRSSVTPYPPLSEPIPGLPTPIYSSAKEKDQETEITVLPNGLRVASENRFGQFCTIGENTTSDDIMRVAHRLLKSPPSVAARGEVRNVPSITDIQAGLLDSRGRVPGSRATLFPSILSIVLYSISPGTAEEEMIICTGIHFSLQNSLRTLDDGKRPLHERMITPHRASQLFERAEHLGHLDSVLAFLVKHAVSVEHVRVRSNQSVHAIRDLDLALVYGFVDALDELKFVQSRAQSADNRATKNYVKN